MEEKKVPRNTRSNRFGFTSLYFKNPITKVKRAFESAYYAPRSFYATKYIMQENNRNNFSYMKPQQVFQPRYAS